MERKPRLYKLKDVLEILDNVDSNFGDGDESYTESECDPEDIVALVTDDQDENGDTSDAETIIYDNVDGPTAARQIPTDCVWQNKTFTPPDITFTGQPLSMTMTMTTLLLNINTGYKLEYTYNMIYYL